MKKLTRDSLEIDLADFPITVEILLNMNTEIGYDIIENNNGKCVDVLFYFYDFKTDADDIAAKFQSNMNAAFINESDYVKSSMGTLLMFRKYLKQN